MNTPVAFLGPHGGRRCLHGRRLFVRFLLAAAGSIGLAISSSSVLAGHQLDEFLGLTHLNVFPDRVDVSLSLTPGAGIVEPVIKRIDTNGDGQVSADEELRYVEKVRSHLTLAIDDAVLTMTLSRVTFPPLELLRSGVGVIQIDLTAPLPPVAVGHHELFYANHNSDEITVYVVNALKPDVPDVVIGRQDRDWYQRHVTVQFELRSQGDGRATPWALGLGIVLAVPLVTWAVRSTRRRVR